MFQMRNLGCDLTHVCAVLTALLPPLFQPHPFLFVSACVCFIPACTYAHAGSFFLDLLYQTKSPTRAGPRPPPPPPHPTASFIPENVRYGGTFPTLPSGRPITSNQTQPANAGGLDIFQPEKE